MNSSQISNKIPVDGAERGKGRDISRLSGNISENEDPVID